MSLSGKKVVKTNSWPRKIIFSHRASLRKALFSIICLLHTTTCKETTIMPLQLAEDFTDILAYGIFSPVLENSSVKIHIQRKHSTLKSLCWLKLCSEGNWSGHIWHNEVQLGNICWSDTVWGTRNKACPAAYTTGSHIMCKSLKDKWTHWVLIGKRKKRVRMRARTRVRERKTLRWVLCVLHVSCVFLRRRLWATTLYILKQDERTTFTWFMNNSHRKSIIVQEQKV